MKTFKIILIVLFVEFILGLIGFAIYQEYYTPEPIYNDYGTTELPGDRVTYTNMSH